MDTNRITKQALQYKPKGQRNIERPRKRWRDQLHLEDQGTGNTPNPSWTWWWWWWWWWWHSQLLWESEYTRSFGPDVTGCTVEDGRPRNRLEYFPLVTRRTMQCMDFGRWSSSPSWRTGLLGEAKRRGVGVHLLGISVWQGQLYLQRRREGLEQALVTRS